MICDACDVGLGSWIGQGANDDIWLSCFHSQKFNPAQLRCLTFQKEWLAIIKTLYFFEDQLRGHQFVIMTDHKPLLPIVQRTPGTGKLRSWWDFLMSFNCTREHTAGKDNYITDALPRMNIYVGISTTKDHLIPHGVDSTTIRSLQEITSNHINLFDHSTTSSPTSNHPCHNMPSCRPINFNRVKCDFNKCIWRAEIRGHHHSCPYPGEEDMEVTSKNDYKVIKKQCKKGSSNEYHLSPVPKELFVNYQVPSANINLTNVYNKLRIVLYQNPLPIGFTTSSPVTMGNESIYHLMALLEGTKKPILTGNSRKPLYNEELAAIVRNATKKVDSQLATIRTNFQWHCYQY